MWFAGSLGPGLPAPKIHSLGIRSSMVDEILHYPKPMYGAEHVCGSRSRGVGSGSLLWCGETQTWDW